MDIEQVKLVVDLIRDLGVQGKEGLIWWLAVKEVLPLLAWTSFGFTALILAARLLRSLGWENEIKQICQIVCPHYSGYVTESEYAETLKEIIKLKEKKNENKPS